MHWCQKYFFIPEVVGLFCHGIFRARKYNVSSFGLQSQAENISVVGVTEECRRREGRKQEQRRKMYSTRKTIKNK